MREKLVSYKMSIDEARSKLYDYYNNVMLGFISSGVYIQKRQQAIKKLIKTFVIIMLLFSPWIYKPIVLWINTHNTTDLILSFLCILLPIICVILFFAYLIIDKNFSNVIKSDCLNNLLVTLFKMNVSNERESISDEEINQSCLFEPWNSRCTEDAFIVASENAKYRISETSMVYKTGSGKHSSITPVFRGLLIKLENSQNLDSSVEITTKTKESIMEDTQDYSKISFLGYSIGILFLFFILYTLIDVFLAFIPFVDNFIEKSFMYLWQNYRIHFISTFTVIVLILSKIYRDWDVKRLQEKQRLRNSQKIKTGDFRIDEDFDIILSNNASDAYKIVNQDLAQLLLKIKNLFSASKVQLKFYGKSIMLAVNTNKDLFELGDLRYTPLNPKVSGSFISQIAAILMFIDYFENEIK